MALFFSHLTWHQPLDQNFYAFAAYPSTYLSEAFGCMCEQWSPDAWLLQQAAGMWRCSSSLARRSTVSLPTAHPACMTGPITQQPAAQTPWNIKIILIYYILQWMFPFFIVEIHSIFCQDVIGKKYHMQF